MAPRGFCLRPAVLIHGPYTRRESAMQVTGLFHVAIKTNDLDATVKFYTEVLGMKLVHRPDFGFPGAWIAAGDSIPIIHIYAGGPALGADGKTPYGTSALDHVSLTIKGWDETLERAQRLRHRRPAPPTAGDP